MSTEVTGIRKDVSTMVALAAVLVGPEYSKADGKSDSRRLGTRAGAMVRASIGAVAAVPPFKVLVLS